MEISFNIYGEPMAKQRPRASAYGKIARVYTPKETISYENKVLSSYLNKCKELNINTESPLFSNSDMIQFEIIALFSLSKADYGKKGLSKSGREKINNVYCTKHKDIDNIAKIVLDALNGVCYKDDKNIVILNVYKKWTEDTPMVKVSIKNVLI